MIDRWTVWRLVAPSAGRRCALGTRVPSMFLALWCGLHVATAAPEVSPFDVAQVTAAEFARLPPYCPYTAAYRGSAPDPAGQYERWKALLGPTLSHLHHYCWGLLKAMRAGGVGVTPQMRRSLFGSAIQECRYVVDRAPQGFVLLPEIFLKMGQYSAELDQLADALEYFEQSKVAKLDYWPAYLEASKVNLRIGRRQQAISALEAGVENTKGDPRLMNELNRIRAQREATSDRQ